MSDFRAALAHFAAELRHHARSAAHAATSRDDGDPYDVVTYRGYGTGERLYVHGRALENEGIAAAADADSRWRNLVNIYKRAESDPLAHARVAIRVGGAGAATHEVTADDEGFFGAWVDAPRGGEELWRPVDVELLAPLRAGQVGARATGYVLTPPPSAAFGVISDVDDTVIQSRVTNFLQAARTVMLGNARTRLPFPGVAAFYQALHHGAGGATRSAQNPIFYVSSSPWNIYDVIAEFLDLQTIPIGPLMLRDWDFSRRALSAGRHLAHKGTVIREIMTTYPQLPFILIGDSGQHDPEIYHQVVNEFPDRVLAVYIRNVSHTPERSASVQKLAAEVLAARSTLVLADDTFAAATHAAEHGWIDPDALPAVHEEKRADEGKTGEKVEPPAGGTEDPKAPTVVVEDTERRG